MIVENPDVDGTSGVLEDKPLMAVDNHRSSPFRDRVYVTWTEFAADGTAYIWSRTSSDYGETFAPRVLVSGASPACTNTFELPTPNGPCNENQFSNPFVGPDGNLYVAWANYNNAAEPPGPEVDQPAGAKAAQEPEPPDEEGDNAYQALLARSTDGGASFSGGDTDVRELPSATSATRQQTTDQWFQWAAFTRDGKLATSYYDPYNNDQEIYVAAVAVPSG